MFIITDRLLIANLMEYEYKLKPRVEIQRNKDGVVAVSVNPLLAIRLNEAAAGILEFCKDWQSPTSLSKQTRVSKAQIEKLLPNLAARQLLERRPVAANLIEWPMVSVIVPVRNRPEELTACVRSLKNLRYPQAKLEIIVVDDFSTDNTPNIIESLGVDKVILRKIWSGPAACRNAGAAVAVGEILAYTDSDCEVDPNWLCDLVPHFTDSSIGVVGGRVDSFSLATAIERYESVASSLYMGEEERDCRPNTAVPFLPTANLLIRRELLQQLGGFDKDFPIGEDVDLVWRVVESGKRVLYVPQGRVLHKYRCRLGRYARRKAFYGGSETFLLRKHPKQQKLFYLPRQRVPFIALLLTGLVTRKWQFSVAALSVPLLESYSQWRRLRKFGARLRPSQVLLSTARNYDGMLFHLCGNLARYYGLLLLVVGPLYRPVFYLAAFCFGYPALHLYFRRKPPLNLPVFAALHWLELLAHQIGMVNRCLQCRDFRPLIPSIRV